MKPWRGELHPRDPGNGEFIDRPGGSWIRAVGDAITSARGRYTPARGRDIRAEVDTDAFRDLAYRLPDNPAPRFEDDPQLAAIARRQGYDGKPEVVDAAELDRRIASGWQELWRGMTGRDDGDSWRPANSPTSGQYAEQFRTGDYWAGLGVRGNGTYTTSLVHVAQEYTPRQGEWYGPRFGDDYEQPGPAWPGLVRMALRPDAKMAEWDEIDGLLVGEKNYDGNTSTDPLLDEGRLAAAMGYDAIIVRSNNNSASIRTVVLLNRTAVAVQEAWQ